MGPSRAPSRSSAPGGGVEQAARDAHRSPAVDALARAGLAARGVVWLVVALLGLSVALGRGEEQTDQQGALRAIVERPFGEALLVVLAVGFAGYALSLALAAAVGHRQESGRDRLEKRLESGGKAVLYVFLAVTTVRFLLGQRSQGDPAPSLTARLLSAPGGRVLLALVGLAVLGVAVALVVRARKGAHAKKIEAWKLPQGWSRTAVRVGTAGQAGRALVLALIGGFLVLAAVRSDASEARGLDAALHAVAQQAYGRVLLTVAVLGLLAYAVWSFLEAAVRRPEA